MTRTIRNLVMALVVTAGAAGAMASPALADPWDHGGGWGGHEWREHQGYGYGAYGVAPYAYGAPAYGYGAPAYGYAAPAYGYGGYAAPPPVAYAPPAASFSLFVPFAFR